MLINNKNNINNLDSKDVDNKTEKEMDETEYLLSTDANRESLLSAVESINRGDWKEWKSYSNLYEAIEDFKKDKK